jgi:cell fate (sporulation/competence/biofilm development) regulator YlbF (YheA/YmcA/DUF963 family)
MQEAIAAIEANERYNELIQAQKSFEYTYKTQNQIESQIDYPLVRSSRKLIAASLNWLLSYVESNASMNLKGFAEAEQEIDEIITDVVSIARARIARVEKEKKELWN